MPNRIPPRSGTAFLLKSGQSLTVIDPMGGINSLWPLFGIANQLLAAVALAVGTVIIIRMGKARFAWLTLLPLTWLATVTLTAGWIKITDANPANGFLARAADLIRQLAAPGLDADKAGVLKHLIFNQYLNSTLCALFMSVIVAMLILCAWEAWLLLSGKRPITTHGPPTKPEPGPGEAELREG